MYIFYIVCCFFLCSLSDKEKTVDDFTLISTFNKQVSLSDYPNAKGFIIIFTCNHCPFAQLYYKRLNELNKKYSKLNVPLIAINSMDTIFYEDEGIQHMKEKAKNNNFRFPYLQDRSQSIGRNFGATHTPQVFLIWKVNNQWVIKYKGAIDDNGERPEIAKSFITQAIDELLVGKKVSQPEMNSIGCKIMYRN